MTTFPRVFSALSAAVLSVVLVSCATDGSFYPSAPGFENLLSSVVKIDVWEKSQKNGGSNTVRSVGSGVIMDSNGMVLTNAHVANMYAEKIVVTLSNLERVRAEFVGWDHWTDLAVIKLDTEDLKRRNITFSHAEFGNSRGLKSGEVVYAVGTPHGFARTVTRGIISNTDRYFEGTMLNSGYETGVFNTWIQTDAAINPGNSGGPLALSDGRVVGINTRASVSANNLGFAVPADVAKGVMDSLVQFHSVRRSYIGVTLSPLQDMEQFYDIGMNRGVIVKNVDTGSPAARAGIVPGDVLLRINGDDVDGRFPEQLPRIMNKIAQMPPGSGLRLDILHSKSEISKALKSEVLESRIGREYTLEKWGVGIQEITKVFARESKIDSDSNLMVIGIRPGYPFDIADIAPGDIIVAIDRKSVSNTAELMRAYGRYCKNPRQFLVKVLRGRAISYHILK